MGRAVVPRRKKHWSYIGGERGRNWVRAFEKGSTGLLFVEWYERSADGGPARRKRASLGHRDREKAKETADAIAASLASAREQEIAFTVDRAPTLHHIIDRYLAAETPHKSRSKRGHDQRAAATFKAFFAKSRNAESLNLGDWNAFIRARRAREVGPPATVAAAQRLRHRGQPVPPLGDRQIEYDLRFLWAVLNWATKTGDENGRILLEANPLRRFVRARDWPQTKNPERPSLSAEQYAGMTRAAEAMDWRFRVAFVLAHETGHRIGSIRKLRWSDVDLDQAWIRWREESDKVGWEHRTPLTEEAQAALGLAKGHRRLGCEEWVLPSPSDTERPCSRNIMRDWWNRAQSRAGLAHIERLGWHSLRRKFANDLRHVPLKDLSSLGGWKDTQTLLKCYLKEDEEAMVQALRSRRSPHARHLAGGKHGTEDPAS
jgi:integrase